MSAKSEYCHFCKKKHSLRSITDNKGNEVALYCSNKRLVVKSDIALWDGEDLYGKLREYVRRTADISSLSRIRPDKIEGLAKKFAYTYCKLPYAIEKRLDYAFTQYHIQTIIVRLRSELRAKGWGKSF